MSDFFFFFNQTLNPEGGKNMWKFEILCPLRLLRRRIQKMRIVELGMYKTCRNYDWLSCVMEEETILNQISSLVWEPAWCTTDLRSGDSHDLLSTAGRLCWMESWWSRASASLCVCERCFLFLSHPESKATPTHTHPHDRALRKKKWKWSLKKAASIKHGVFRGGGGCSYIVIN